MNSPNLLKSILLFISLLIPAFILGACNTTSGIGQDIEAAGDKIEDEAEENKNY